MTIMCKESVGASYDAIKTMNDIAGQLDGSEDSIDLALSLCFEELSEAIGAFEAGDVKELAKEAIDLWVVTVGLLQKLEAAGFDMELAMRLVDANNLSKFPLEYPKSYPKETASITFSEKYRRYVLKRGDGKFLKPGDFKKVDLTGVTDKVRVPLVR